MKTFEEVAEELGWNLADDADYLLTLAREFFEAGVREGVKLSPAHKISISKENNENLL